MTTKATRAHSLDWTMAATSSEAEGGGAGAAGADSGDLTELEGLAVDVSPIGGIALVGL